MMLKATPLPTWSSCDMRDHPSGAAQSAYELVLQGDRSASDDKAVMHARIVGYLLLELWTFRTKGLGVLPVQNMTLETITSGAELSNEDIQKLGTYYYDTLLRPCKSSWRLECTF